MPNWCENELYITCNNPESFQKFMELSGIDKNNFKLNNIRPMPKKLASIQTGSTTIDGVEYTRWTQDKEGNNQVGISPTEMDALLEEYGASDWYDWGLKYWGCKWDVEDVDYMGYDAGNCEAHLWFNTAWGPPEELYLYIRLHYPDIEMNWFYKEPGFQIAGWLGSSE